MYVRYIVVLSGNFIDWGFIEEVEFQTRLNSRSNLWRAKRSLDSPSLTAVAQQK